MIEATSIGDAVAVARKALVEAGIDAAALDARLLVADATGFGSAQMIGWSDLPLSPDARDRLAERLRRRLDREPLAYIVGEKEFWSLPFAVDRRVLVPRPDSETLVEAALAGITDRSRPLRILDLGTGSGCLLLALLSELPAASGIGVDLSAPALRLAADNARRLGLAGRAAFVQSDWSSAIGGRFDLVVANPPYVADAAWYLLAPEITRHEPRLALVGGSDGLAAYRRILPDLDRVLGDAGTAFLELGAGQLAAVIDIVTAAGLQWIEGNKDLAGVVRVVQVATERRGGQETAWKQDVSCLVSNAR